MNKHFFLFLGIGTDTYPHDNGIVRALKSNYKPNDRVVGDPKHTIFIGRLHLKTDEVKVHFCGSDKTNLKSINIENAFLLIRKKLSANFNDMVKL